MAGGIQGGRAYGRASADFGGRVEIHGGQAATGFRHNVSPLWTEWRQKDGWSLIRRRAQVWWSNRTHKHRDWNFALGHSGRATLETGESVDGSGGDIEVLAEVEILVAVAIYPSLQVAPLQKSSWWLHIYCGGARATPRRV